MNNSSHDAQRAFSESATDILLSFVSLQSGNAAEFDETDEILADIEKSLNEMTETERNDLAPVIRAIAAKLI